MANPGRKSIALFVVLSIFSLTLFDWEWPSLSHFKFSWAYAIGMTAAVVFSMTDRFLKHVRSAEFSWWKLIKTHLLAFLLTYFFITVGPKFIPVNDLWDSFLTPKDDKKTKA
jgi:antibiotic biosynthesis monooxygenase (ABM) superfamily enzyme